MYSHNTIVVQESYKYTCIMDSQQQGKYTQCIFQVAMNCLKHDENGSQHCAVEELDLHQVTV